MGHFYFLFEIYNNIYILDFIKSSKPIAHLVILDLFVIVNFDVVPRNMQIKQIIEKSKIPFTNFEEIRDIFTFSPKNITRIRHYNLDRLVN